MTHGRHEPPRVYRQLYSDWLGCFEVCVVCDHCVENPEEFSGGCGDGGSYD